VSILEKFRRRGLGRLLLGKVLFELKSRGVKEVILETNAENPFGARSLYSSVGFTITKKHLRSRKPVKSATT
ncbi:MAG: GNAT family N-acetyltransferase, partial [Acidimicrobiia bacterium]|nr:GNAT family N-acetyltransferase [Acidimicrobiia bacterium]